MREELLSMKEKELEALEEHLKDEARTVVEIRANLQKTKEGSVRQTISNCLYVLQHDPVFDGAIRKNELIGRMVISKKCPGSGKGKPIQIQTKTISNSIWKRIIC